MPRAGSSTRSCAWRGVACGQGTSSRASSTAAGHHVHQLYRAEAGTIQAGSTSPKYITMPSGELGGKGAAAVDDLADSGITLKAVVERLRGMPAIQELRSAVIWTKGRSRRTRPTTTARCWKPLPGSTSRSKSTTAWPEALARNFPFDRHGLDALHRHLQVRGLGRIAKLEPVLFGWRLEDLRRACAKTKGQHFRAGLRF